MDGQLRYNRQKCLQKIIIQVHVLQTACYQLLWWSWYSCGEFCDDFIGNIFADSMLSAVLEEFWRVVGERCRGVDFCGGILESCGGADVGELIVVGELLSRS